MSVNYYGAIIYGYDIRDLKIDCEQAEILEEQGFDIITDYNGNRLFVGLTVSVVCERDEIHSLDDKEFSMDAIKEVFEALVHNLPQTCKELLAPAMPSLSTYHVCYAS